MDEKLDSLMEKPKKRKELVDFKNELKKRINDKDDYLNQLLSKEDLKKINDVVDDLDSWLNKNPNASKEEMEKKKNQINNIVNPILKTAEIRNNLNKKSIELKDRMNDKNDYLSKLNSKGKKKKIK
jgi:molecular chaperone DnaK (HSP70)